MKWSYLSKRAFTLAEVLITLLIIGIVAILVLPNFVTQWREKANNQQKEIFEQKLIEATKRMNINEDLSPYSDTVTFVNKFGKYVKITDTCVGDKLTNCFVNKFYTEKGEEIDTSKLVNSKSFTKDYNTENVGMQILDGKSLIISYYPDCSSPDPYDSKSSTTSCLSYILDINGGQKPNVIGEDIILASVSIKTKTCDGIEISDTKVCASSGDVNYNYTNKPCLSSSNYNPCAAYGNYFDGAQLMCSSLGMRLPTMKELKDMYNHKSELNISTGWYWSSEEFRNSWGDEAAYGINFANGTTTEYGKHRNGLPSTGKVRCVKAAS